MTSPRSRRFLAMTALALVAFAGGAMREALATCGVFADVPDGNAFCASILQVYYLGITSGTTPTTYGPSATVTREQMAAFLARTYDRTASRTSRRAALGQWWTTTPHYDQQDLGLTTVGSGPRALKSDGADVWVARNVAGTVSRVRASDGKLLETWTGATSGVDVLVAIGRVFVAGNASPGNLYLIDPASAPGAVTTVATDLGNFPRAIAFDGTNIWTANSNSVSIITPGSWSVSTVSPGFLSLFGILYDGTSMWVADSNGDAVRKLNADGSIAQTVTVGDAPVFPVFDGNNIWVPNFNSSSLTVVRASDGTVLKTFSAANGDQNGLNAPAAAAFDGQRILVTNSGGGLSLFKAADLSPIGFFATAGVLQPQGACSDGVHFWIAFLGSDKIGRF